MPRMQRKPADAGLFYGLARRGKVECFGRLVMTARLQPATDDDMVDQQHLSVIRRQDDRTGGDVARKGVALVKRMSCGHLPAQQRKMFTPRGDLGAIARHCGFKASPERNCHGSCSSNSWK